MWEPWLCAPCLLLVILTPRSLSWLLSISPWARRAYLVGCSLSGSSFLFAVTWTWAETGLTWPLPPTHSQYTSILAASGQIIFPQYWDKIGGFIRLEGGELGVPGLTRTLHNTWQTTQSKYSSQCLPRLLFVFSVSLISSLLSFHQIYFRYNQMRCAAIRGWVSWCQWSLVRTLVTASHWSVDLYEGLWLVSCWWRVPNSCLW